MILKEQWLIVTQNIKSLQEISKQKLELKQKKNSDKLRSDHKGQHRKGSQISKNDTEDKQKVSKTENH